ncbi:MAG: putative lipopolysaccharide heptosyltransferase III [Nitrospiraceae bacterium]
MNRILVIKLRYIGDVLLATPVLHALRDRFPDARLTMLVNRGTENILKWNPDVDEVLTVDRGTFAAQLRLVGALRRRHFDCVLDLTDGDRSSILARLTGAPVRIGFNEERRWRGLLYTSVVQPNALRHRVARDLETVRALGIEPKASPLVLCTSSEDDKEADRLLVEAGMGGASAGTRPLVLLHPGARYWFKAWPAERFAELADRLTDACSCRVLIGGDAHDKPVAETIRARARSAPAVLAGRTTLLQLAALLKRCALFIGNDNGPMHMAAAVGTPIVALFGPSDPAEWGPVTSQAEILYKGLDCRRCFHPTCDRGEQSCMRQITVDEVFSAAQRFLEKVEVKVEAKEKTNSELPARS